MAQLWAHWSHEPNLGPWAHGPHGASWLMAFHGALWAHGRHGAHGPCRFNWAKFHGQATMITVLTENKIDTPTFFPVQETVAIVGGQIDQEVLAEIESGLDPVSRFVSGVEKDASSKAP